MDEILIFTVNDGAVVDFWAKDLLKVPEAMNGDFFKVAGDPKGDLAKACGMELTATGPVGVLGHGRSKRFACIVDDGKVSFVAVSESDEDPAGDTDPSASMPDAILRQM